MNMATARTTWSTSTEFRGAVHYCANHPWGRNGAGRAGKADDAPVDDRARDAAGTTHDAQHAQHALHAVDNAHVFGVNDDERRFVIFENPPRFRAPRQRLEVAT